MTIPEPAAVSRDTIDAVLESLRAAALQTLALHDYLLERAEHNSAYDWQDRLAEAALEKVGAMLELSIKALGGGWTTDCGFEEWASRASGAKDAMAAVLRAAAARE
jgi:hypothetical protein